MAKELTAATLKEYAKLSLVNKAITALIDAAKANNMSIAEMSELIAAMAERRNK